MEGVISRYTESLVERISSSTTRSSAASLLKVNGTFIDTIGGLVWEIATGRGLEEPRGLTRAVLKFQLALDPSSLFNTVTNNSSFFMWLAGAAGLETCAVSLDPLKAFLNSEMASASPDPDGFIIDKYLAAAEEASSSSSSKALLSGKGGRQHILGSLIDLFVGGTTAFDRLGATMF